jgi:UDP-2-acetamido-3-amino-2,3-dideoxy-glucuronate N-acetyltransferase
LGQNVFVAAGVVLGSNVKVQNNVSIYAGVTCEDDVFLGPSVVFTNVLTPRSAVPRRGQYVATLVQKGASIGANATIVCGTVIGQHALVGAGAVVTKNVPPHALVVGNPARQVGWVSHSGHKLLFNPKNIAICPETQQKYELINKKQVKSIN